MVSLLELKHISKAYEGTPLLADISFRLKAGETVCLLGASGSGKSTLLRMIAGLETPDRGLILFDGIDLARTPPHLRDFGLVFQDYELFPHLNVFDNVAFGLRMRRISAAEIDERVATLLEQMNLNGFSRRRVTDLSGGEQQRVALARALATRPRLLMFDEPLGALDRSLKEDLLKELRTTLRKTKIPAIYVTHDQEEAFVIADRILLLRAGEIVRAGTPADIWSDPGSAWAAQFLGAGNLVEGSVNARGKVQTDFGEFALTCNHKHSKGEKIPLLIRQSSGGREELKLKVEDVLFNRDQFEVHARGEAASRDGLVIQTKQKPAIGRVIRVRVKVECLHEDPKERSRR
jgi:ABC-type Fe3+/spermidine/putrescine transport system ATPase subunit